MKQITFVFVPVVLADYIADCLMYFIYLF